jgi:hypothetical protein
MSGPIPLTEVGAYALRYARIGWEVLPVHGVRDGTCTCGEDCGHPAKHPVGVLVPNGFRDATTDEKVIATWFSTRDYNVGIATGAISGLVVLDVDPRHGGDASLRELFERSDNLPNTVRARTGGGGQHVFFVHPGRRVTSRAGICPGLDVRGDGGFVVAPPSLHASGARYVWEAGHGPDETALAAAPDWLLALVDEGGRRQDHPAAGEPIPEGERNASLMSFAGTMRRRGMTEAEIVAALRVVNADRCRPPLEEDEVQQIAVNICQYTPADSAAAPGGAGAAATTFRFRTAAQIARETPAEVQWAAKPWLALGASTELDGKIKTAGKTTLASHMVRCILDGTSFLDQPTTASPVVWLTEQSLTSFREVLRRADLLTREDLFVLCWHEVVGRTWPMVASATVTEAVRRNAKVIVVDTLGRFAGLRGDAENSAGEAAAAVQAIVDPATAQGIAALLLRHERKSGGEVGEAARGSSAFGGAVDIILSLGRVENAPRGAIRQLRALSRFDETPEKLVIELTSEGYVALGDEECLITSRAHVAIMALLPTNEGDALTLEEITHAVGVGRTTVQNELKALHADPTTGVTRIGTGARGNAYRFYRKVQDETGPKETENEKETEGEKDQRSSGREKIGAAGARPLGAAAETNPSDLKVSNARLAILQVETEVSARHAARSDMTRAEASSLLRANNPSLSLEDADATIYDLNGMRWRLKERHDEDGKATTVLVPVK